MLSQFLNSVCPVGLASQQEICRVVEQAEILPADRLQAAYGLIDLLERSTGVNLAGQTDPVRCHAVCRGRQPGGASAHQLYIFTVTTVRL